MTVGDCGHADLKKKAFETEVNLISKQRHQGFYRGDSCLKQTWWGYFAFPSGGAGPNVAYISVFHSLFAAHMLQYECLVIKIMFQLVEAFNQGCQCGRKVVDTINKTTSSSDGGELETPQVSQPRGALLFRLKKKDPREITDRSLSSRRKHGIICRSFKQRGLQEVVAVTFVPGRTVWAGEIMWHMPVASKVTLMECSRDRSFGFFSTVERGNSGILSQH